MSQPAPVDLQALLELTGGDDAFVRELTATYLDSSTANLRAIDEACGGGDLPALRRAAHSLKGASANMYARGVAEAAAALEQSAANADHAACQTAAERVRQEFERAATYLRSVAT